MERKFSSLLAEIYGIHKKISYPDFDELDMLILSCPFSASYDYVKARRSGFIDSIYKSRNSLFLNCHERSILLRTSLFKNNLHPSSMGKIQLSLVSDARNAFSNLSLQFLNCFFRVEPDRSGEKFTLGIELLETAVNAWVWVGKDSNENGKLLRRQIRAIISSMLAHSLKNDTVHAACLLSLLEKYPGPDVLDLFLDFSIEEKPLVLAEIDFLNTILKTDTHRFVEHMLSSLRDMRPRMLNAWKLGYLDDSVSLLLRQVKSSSSASKSLLEVVASIASTRLIDSLISDEIPALDGNTPLLNLMCEIFDRDITISTDAHLIASELIKIVSLLSELESSWCYGQGTKDLCSFGICLLGYLKTINKHTELQERLSLELFSFLFAALPNILKNEKSSHVSTSLPSGLVLTWLIRLIKDDSDHLVSRRTETSIYEKVCRACLKHGIASANDGEKNPALLLHFMGLLMINKMHNDPTNPTAKEVFDMIVSHSKFEQLFTNAENNEGDVIATGSKAKDNVLRLMITCVMVSSDDIQIKPFLWKVIFASFNAGITHTDILIRSLVNISCEDSLPFMDELHWKGCETNNQEQNATGKLDWVIAALDATRIRASISRFPVFDRLDLAIAFDDIWDENFYTKRLDQIGIPMETDQPPSNYIKTKLLIDSVDLSSKDREIADTEQYSPAFLLPLVLKSIESWVSGKKRMHSAEVSTSTSGDDEDNGEPMPPWVFSKASIESIQQLCGKGIVSFCLASLSSSCEKTRCYAVAILGLILQACHSNYALDSPSWRYRPQLAMILNSVQRSLVLHKALDQGDSTVPRVTPVIATFLARAATVLPKPDDALYVPMNRYFLKNEASHGAFQDMKRLPAFMSLFCSASEDSNQSRAERMWGLRLLCDGLVDSSCYKLVSICYAPELILSSFENVRLSKASDEAKGAEICLLLGSLKAMIDHGEYGAHIHLIRRCGLLSWMSSVCSSRSMTTTFPTERSRISFCHLANSVFERVFFTHRLRSSELIDEVCSLIQPIVSLGLIKCRTEEPSGGMYQTSLQTLSALALGLQTMKDEEFLCPDIQPTGVSLESSLSFLRIADDSTKALSLQTLCSLPISLQSDLQQDTAQHFIVLMLDCFKSISNNGGPESSLSMSIDSDNLIMVLLRRILLLMEQREIMLGSKNPTSNDIVRKIFALRCNIRFSHANVRKMWSRCLEITAPKAHSDDTEVNSLEQMICKDICERERLRLEFQQFKTN